MRAADHRATPSAGEGSTIGSERSTTLGTSSRLRRRLGNLFASCFFTEHVVSPHLLLKAHMHFRMPRRSLLRQAPLALPTEPVKVRVRGESGQGGRRRLTPPCSISKTDVGAPLLPCARCSRTHMIILEPTDTEKTGVSSYMSTGVPLRESFPSL